MLDLLTPLEERDRANVFDIRLLASRLVEATDWVGNQTPKRIPVSLNAAPVDSFDVPNRS